MDVKSIDSFSYSQLIKNNFHVLETSTQNVLDSQIIFLGNMHYQQEQQWKISWLIQQLYQDGDIVLVESFYDHPKNCSETQFVAKKINIEGWDSKVREKEFAQREYLIKALLHIDHVRRIGLAHENWIEDIYRLIRMFPPCEKTCEEIIRDMYPREKIINLHTLEKRLDCFNKLVFYLASIWLEYLKKGMLDDLTVRNKSMIRAINKHLSRSSRIFVIAGIAHLTLNNQFNHFEETMDGVRLIHQYCNDKKYVVLYPNENKANLYRIKAELRPSLRAIFEKFINYSNYFTIIKAVFVVPLFCCGILAITLPFLIYCKTINCFTVCDLYYESLKKLPLPDLMVLIGFAAENPQSLPRQSSLFPLK